MGIIRKTLSISTLGVVSFRSKKELLRRAEQARQDAELELDRQQSARADADRRVAEAERRVKLAELAALREAKSAAKKQRRAGRGPAGRRGRRKRRLDDAKERFSDVVSSTQPVAEDAAQAVGRRARRAAKAARRAAGTAQEELGRRGRRARKRLRAAEAAAAPHVESAKERAAEIKDEVVDRTSSAVADARERLDEARGRDQ